MATCKCLNCMGDFDYTISEICPNCAFNRNTPVTDRNILPPATILAAKYLLGNKIDDNSTGYTYIAWNNFENKKILIREYFPKDLCERNTADGSVVVSPTTQARYVRGKEVFVARGNGFMEASRNLPGIAAVYEVFEEKNTAYIACEFAEGVKVSEVAATRSIPWNNFRDIISPVIKTAGALNKLGLIHQNITPENIIVTPDRMVKLVAFDCLNEGKVTTPKSTSKALDSFTPVELYRNGSGITPACDVYSIAAVIYNTITGIQLPAAPERAKRGKLAPISGACPDIDKNTENAIMNALEVDATDRTASCADLYEELYSGKTVERKTRAKSGKKAAIIISAAVVLLAVGFTLFMLFGRGDAKITDGEALGTVPNIVDLPIDTAITQLKKEEKKKDADEEDEKDDKPEIVYNVRQPEGQTLPTSDETKDACIARQDPKPGTEIMEDSEFYKDGVVTIIVTLYEYDEDAEDTGDSLLEVPDVTGKTVKDAKAAMEEAGIKCSVTNAHSSVVDSGKVISQSEKGGSSIVETKTVILTVSKGPEPTTTAPAKPFTGGKKTTQPTTQKPEPTKPKSEPNTTLSGDEFFA